MISEREKLLLRPDTSGARFFKGLWANSFNFYDYIVLIFILNRTSYHCRKNKIKIEEGNGVLSENSFQAQS